VVQTQARSAFTRAQDDCLKALYHLGGDAQPVSTGALAQRLGISSASVIEMVDRLSGQGLVSHDRYRGQQLTADGRRAALELIRHHRLIEMFLVQVLGFGWDEVHEEAERLEHVISERMEERIFELLGRPDLDPHGHAIPSRDGTLPAVADRPLSECRAGEGVVVRSVSDSDPQRLRELEKRGIKPGVRLQVLAGTEYESPIEARIEKRRQAIPLGLAREIFVEETEA
jgi:DtxR family Mn-dependent transcriptional regulator